MPDRKHNPAESELGSETSPSRPPNDKATPSEEFIRAFTQSQRPLFLYLLPLLGNGPDVDEVLQETNLVIWSKWRQFEPGTNFLAWGRAIARLEVFRFRRGRKLVYLEDDLLEAISVRTEVISEETELRQQALASCVSELRSKDRELIEARYAPGANGDLVAQQLGRPANSVYQSLGRIRRVLMECVRIRLAEARLAEEGGLP
jgi:RNA polymerase sigma-70 factor (ECF subfamily)